MKQKIGTLIEEDIMRLAKRRAAEEGRSLSDLIQDALLQYPQMKQAVSVINAQIHSLAPALNSPTLAGAAAVTSSNPNVPVDVLVKDFAGARYLFAVAMRAEATLATFAVPGLPPSSTATVLGENRQIGVQNGVFSDFFQPYEVHLYRIQGN